MNESSSFLFFVFLIITQNLTLSLSRCQHQNMEENKTETVYYPSFCSFQNDWELSIPKKSNNKKSNEEDNTFWISLIKHGIDENNRCYIDASINITNYDKDKTLRSDLIIKNNANDVDEKNNNFIDWKMKICALNNDYYKEYYYGKVNCLDHGLNDYKIIPYFKKIGTENKNERIAINCLDIAKSSYFKRFYILCGLENGKINIYDVESNKLKMKCDDGNTGNHGRITQCKFFPFGDLILSGDTKGILNIYAIADPKGKPAVNFTVSYFYIFCILALSL